VAIFKENIFGLDVAVNDPVSVCVGKRVGNFTRDQTCVVERQESLSTQTAPQCLTFDMGHYVVRKSVCRSGVEKWQDVRVVQTRGESDLGEKTISSEYRGDFGPQKLDRDRPVMLEIAGKKHR
jgi:hypothetical protein